MKTSTKLLLAGLFIIFGLIIIIMLIVRNDLKTSEKFNNKSILIGNRIKSEEIRKVEPFNKIITSEGIKVYLIQDTCYSVKIEADSNIIQAIETNLTDDALIINTSARIKNAKWMNVYVTFNSVNEIKSHSGSVLETRNTLTAENLILSFSGGTMANLELKVDALNLQSGSGNITTLRGLTNKLMVNTNSGSVIDARDMKAGYAEIEASSGSIVKLGVADTLDVSVSSGSVIKYQKGMVINLKTSSGGSLIKD